MKESNEAYTSEVKPSMFFETVITTLMIITLVKWIYDRRKFYELSLKLPGPFCFPLIGNARRIYQFMLFGKVPANYLTENVKKYSSLYRDWIGSDFHIFITDPEDVECLSLSNKLGVKPPKYLNHWITSMGDGILTSSGIGPQWKQHRKFIAPSFRTSTLARYEETLQKQMKLLVDDIKQLCDMGLVDYSKIILRNIGDVVTETLFEYPQSFRDGNNDTALEGAEVISKAVFKRMTNILYQAEFLYKMTKHYKKEEESSKNVFSFIKRMHTLKMKEYKEMLKNQDSFDENPSTMHVLLEAEYNKKMTNHEVDDEISNVWNAAVDATALIINFLVLMMGMHPECQQKAVDEIRANFPDNKAPVNREKLSELKYVDMCVKETLRMFPAGPVTVRLAIEDIYIKTRDITVPAGTTIVLSSYALHRDPKIWPQPDEYIPERFSSEEVAKRHTYSYIPFSIGSRACIGQVFSQMMMKSALVHLLMNFQFHSDWKMRDLPLTHDINIRCDWGYSVKITERKW